MAEAASVVAEPEPVPVEPAPVEPEPVPVEVEATPEVEAVVPEEAAVPDEVAVAVETAAPDPLPVEPETEAELAEVRVEVEGGGVDVSVSGSGAVRAPDAVGKRLGPDGSGEAGSLPQTNAWAGPAAGATDPAPGPDLLPTPTPRLPELRLPAAIEIGPQLNAPIAATPSAPSPSSGAPVLPHPVSPSPAPSLSPNLFVLLSADEQGRAVKGASADPPAGPLVPERSPSDHLRVGSTGGGSSFLPLLGLLALLALAVPRGYRRRIAVRHFPVPTAFVCALERPG